MPKPRHPERAGLHLRVVLDGQLVMGPGRAELLAHIAELGSISAAGRAMGMSYRRAWTLAEETGATFHGRVVAAAPGGAGGGGASLTPLGRTLLETYRRLEQKAAAATAAELAELRRLMQDCAAIPGDPP